MKKEYMKPKMHVVKIQHSGIICTSPGGGSGWDVIGPDEPDAPAGARGYRGGIDWDDWDDWKTGSTYTATFEMTKVQ